MANSVPTKYVMTIAGLVACRRVQKCAIRGCVPELDVYRLQVPTEVVCG